MVEKDIGKIPKNDTTNVVIRVDDFGGRPGVTIREFVTSDRYTGFTKSGVKIPASHFKAFKEMINSVNEDDLRGGEAAEEDEERVPTGPEESAENNNNAKKEELPDY